MKRAISLCLAFAVSTTAPVSAFADVVPILKNPLTTPPAGLAEMQIPTNKVKNQIGQIAERTCLRNGKAAAVCAATALVVGGVGVNRLMDKSWADIAKAVAFGTLYGAASGAGVGCLYGGIVGGVAAAGVGAIPGCVAGLLEGAITGGFCGAFQSVTNLAADGTMPVVVAADPGAQVAGGAGSTVQGNTAGGLAAVIMDTANLRIAGPRPNLPSRLMALGYPVLTKFPCRNNSAETVYLQCMIVPMVYGSYDPIPDRAFDLGPDGQPWTGVKYLYYLNPYSMSFVFSTPNESRFQVTQTQLNNAGAVCSAGSDTCWSQVDGDYPFAQSAADVGHTFYNVFVNTNVTNTISTNVPQTQFVTQPLPPAWALGFVPNMNSATLSKQLSDQFVAALVNAAWYQAGAAAQSPYDATAPVTTVDAANQRAVDPNNALLLQDFIKPMADPTAQGGNAAKPLVDPLQVTPVGPNASPAPATPTPTQILPGSSPANPNNTREINDQELDSNSGLFGDVTEPIRAFATGAFASLLHPIVNIPNASCPVITIDLPTLLGHPSQSHPADTAFLCTWFDSQRVIFIGFLHLMYTISFGMIVLRKIQ